MNTTSTTKYPIAGAFLNYARRFNEGAEIIHAANPQLTMVLNAMYFHVVECLLKAYLKHRSKERWGHKLGELCVEAQGLGLQIDSDKSGSNNLLNVARLLVNDKGDAGFRYFTLHSRSQPDLDWTRAVVAELMAAVAPEIEAAAEPSRLAKFDITWKIV